MKYINCQECADEIIDGLKGDCKKQFVIVSVGDNPASQSYIKGKMLDCDRCGIFYSHINIELGINDAPLFKQAKQDLEDTLTEVANDEKVGAIILQLPLPHGWDEEYYTSLIPPQKDVDGLTHGTMFSPCTPEGIINILKRVTDISGANVLIVGRGKLVGRPLFDMLLERDATVTLAHSKTKNLPSLLPNYDIIISAAGKPNLVDLKQCVNAKVVIDVGVNRVGGKLCGDCYNFSEAELPNLLVTPVPRGIGLMTRAILMEHVSKLCKKPIALPLPALRPYDIIEIGWNEELRISCDDEIGQFDGIVHPNCDDEFEEERITRVWRLKDDDFVCIFKRRKE